MTENENQNSFSIGDDLTEIEEKDKVQPTPQPDQNTVGGNEDNNQTTGFSNSSIGDDLKDEQPKQDAKSTTNNTTGSTTDNKSKDTEKSKPKKDKKTNKMKNPFTKNNINKVKNNLKNFKKTIKEEKKYIFFAVLFLFIIVLGFTAFQGYTLYNSYEQLNKKTENLDKLSTYLKGNKLKNLKNNLSKEELYTIKDLLTIKQKIGFEKQKIENIFLQVQAPYKYFLKHIYLPSLNIWENPYTQKVNINLIGQDYLEKNPYIDTNLLDKWSDFFTEVGGNGAENDIENIAIGDIKSQEDFFSIPMQIAFTSPHRRSFIMLLSKLSTTSNKQNISLINEFIYNIWKIIKQDNFDQIKKTINATSETDRPRIKNLKRFINEDKIKSYENFTDPKINKNEDLKSHIDNLHKFIGETFYKRIKNGKPNKLISEDIINKAIVLTARCEGVINDNCYYEFREKYRDIPNLAYTLGSPTGEKTVQLKHFLKNLPPILKLGQFNFEKLTGIEDKGQYNGNISLDIFGREISDNELINIQKKLGKDCFGKGELDTNSSLDTIKSAVKNLSESEKKLNSSRSNELITLEQIIEEIKAKYPNLPNHKKAIKLFELYRMLNDSNLCSIK